MISFASGKDGLERSEPRVDFVGMFDTDDDGRISFAEFESVVAGKS